MISHWVNKDAHQVTYLGKRALPFDRQDLFQNFNCKSEVIRYLNIYEYHYAGIDSLHSSSSWTKEETDCLMDLCERYDLRF